MKTYTITGYQSYGTRDSSAYFVDVTYRGEAVAMLENAAKLRTIAGGAA